MKLKEIKPVIVIHCKNDDEKKALLEEAERLGYVWYSTKEKPTEKSVHDIGNTIHFYDAGTNSFSADYKHITHSCEIGNTEFSDLILPELTAEETLSIISEIHKASYGKIDGCIGCPLERVTQNCETDCFKENADKIIEICQQWKSDHEKKEQEIEWVYRVYNGESEEFVDSEEKAISECEFLVKDKPEKYAFYQKVCRVKAVE